MERISPLLEKLPEIRGSYRCFASLSKTNWFNVGGPAEILFRPADQDDLMSFLKNRPTSIPLTILGVGSNLLVRDGGIPGVVIKLGREFTHMSHDNTLLTAGAGALSYNVASYAASRNIGNLEFLCGIPGTVGGALAMNAGAYNNDVATVLVTAEVVDDQGNPHLLSPHDIGYVYRGHTLPEGMIFTKATFQGTCEPMDVITERMDKITQARQTTQPIKTRTSGSTFKNPEGKKAWQLIDEAGCRGLTIGGAQVSNLHCNFFINTGNATATDIENLGKEVIRRVKDYSGIELIWEIKIIGEKDPI